MRRGSEKNCWYFCWYTLRSPEPTSCNYGELQSQFGGHQLHHPTIQPPLTSPKRSGKTKDFRQRAVSYRPRTEKAFRLTAFCLGAVGSPVQRRGRRDVNAALAPRMCLTHDKIEQRSASGACSREVATPNCNERQRTRTFSAVVERSPDAVGHPTGQGPRIFIFLETLDRPGTCVMAIGERATAV